MERPLSLGVRRRVAEVRVARLITQVRRYDDVARWRTGSDRQLHADRERLLEDGQRLIGAGLLEVG